MLMIEPERAAIIDLGRCLHAEKYAHLVDVNHAPVIGQGCIGEPAGDPDAGVVNEHVQPPVPVHYLLHHRCPFVLARDVVVQIPAAERRRGLLPVGIEHVGNYDRRALRRKQCSFGCALSARPAGDQCDLPIESGHRAAPFGRRAGDVQRFEF